MTSSQIHATYLDYLDDLHAIKVEESKVQEKITALQHQCKHENALHVGSNMRCPDCGFKQ